MIKTTVVKLHDKNETVTINGHRQPAYIFRKFSNVNYFTHRVNDSDINCFFVNNNKVTHFIKI